MEGDDDLSQLLFRLRLFNRVAQLSLFSFALLLCFEHRHAFAIGRGLLRNWCGSATTGISIF